MMASNLIIECQLFLSYSRMSVGTSQVFLPSSLYITEFVTVFDQSSNPNAASHQTSIPYPMVLKKPHLLAIWTRVRYALTFK